MGELLVEVASQAIQLFCLAQILSGDGFVEPGRESAIVRPPPFVSAKMARALWLSGSLGVAHVRVVGHIGGRGPPPLRRRVGHVLARHPHVFPAHPPHPSRLCALPLSSRFPPSAIPPALP